MAMTVEHVDQCRPPNIVVTDLKAKCYETGLWQVVSQLKKGGQSKNRCRVMHVFA